MHAHLLQTAQRGPRSFIVLRRELPHEERVSRGDVLEGHAHRKLAAELLIEPLGMLEFLERDGAEDGTIPGFGSTFRLIQGLRKGLSATICTLSHYHGICIANIDSSSPLLAIHD
jgi:hypothetical protein